MLEWGGSGGSPPVHLQLWQKRSRSDRQSEREARLKRRVLPISLNSSFKNIIQAEGLFSSQIKFISKNENDIEGLIYQLKETNMKGYLKKNYDLMLTKLKTSDEVNFDGKLIIIK